MSLIVLEGVNKKYGDKCVLNNFNLEIKEGEFLGIKGKSGRGKTTLLNIIGLQETYEGACYYDGKKVDIKNKKWVRKLLKEEIGYLFQNFALVEDRTVYDNLRIVIGKKKKKNVEALMSDALEMVGLKKELLYQKVYKCSGGEQQRIAVARLILKNCKTILADEPTGSLDRENAHRIMNLLARLNAQGKTVIMVSHDDSMLSYCKRVIDI